MLTVAAVVCFASIVGEEVDRVSGREEIGILVHEFWDHLYEQTAGAGAEESSLPLTASQRVGIVASYS